MKSSAKPVTDQAGNVLYYLGELTITDEIDYALRGDECQTMSYFSSWGVPGSLELKPEITAPGGNIYSLDGVTLRRQELCQQLRHLHGFAPGRRHLGGSGPVHPGKRAGGKDRSGRPAAHPISDHVHSHPHSGW